MKKIYLTYALTFIGIALIGNPILRPFSWVDKLSFDKNQQWQINLNISGGEIDSMAISSSSGKSKCKVLTIQWEGDFHGLIITTDSLISKVNINPEGDSVSIITYPHYGDSILETFIYGNYKNSNIPKPSKDQVINAFWTTGEYLYHSLCDSTGNMQGVIKGHVYNRNNVLITKGSISINPYLIDLEGRCGLEGFTIQAINISNEGSYSAMFYAQIYSLNQLKICSNLNLCPYYYSSIGTSKITPLDFSLYPDSTIELDIHLLENFTAINKMEAKSNELLKIFPNPIKGGSFHYEIGIPIKATQCKMDLIDMTGRKLESYDIIENAGELQLPSTITNGTYLIQLQMNGKKLFSDQIIVSKK